MICDLYPEVQRMHESVFGTETEEALSDHELAEDIETLLSAWVLPSHGDLYIRPSKYRNEHVNVNWQLHLYLAGLYSTVLKGKRLPTPKARTSTGREFNGTAYQRFIKSIVKAIRHYDPHGQKKAALPKWSGQGPIRRGKYSKHVRRTLKKNSKQE